MVSLARISSHPPHAHLTSSRAATGVVSPKYHAAVVVAMFFMMLASQKLSAFINRHPSIKLLALAFLLLIGISLIAEGIEEPIAKGYIYFAMSFSIFVVALIIRFVKKKGLPAQLNEKINVD